MTVNGYQLRIVGLRPNPQVEYAIERDRRRAIDERIEAELRRLRNERIERRADQADDGPAPDTLKEAEELIARYGVEGAFRLVQSQLAAKTRVNGRPVYLDERGLPQRPAVEHSAATGRVLSVK